MAKSNPKSAPAPAGLRYLAPSAPAGTQALLAAAEARLAGGDIDAADPLLRQVLQCDPASAAAHGLLAIVALVRGHPAAALQRALAAVQLAPRDARHHFTLGRAHKAGGELDAAAAAYRRAIELAPRFAEPHVSLGIVLKAQGELDGAIACHRRALALAPTLAVAHANLGAALALQAERAQQHGADEPPAPALVEAQRRAVALDPADPELQRNLGAVLLRAGRHHEAAGAFNAALTLDPSDLQSCLHLGACLAALGDHDLARQAYEKWLRLNARHAGVMQALAAALIQTGEVDAALAWAEKAQAAAPHPLTELQIGHALVQMRRQAEGLARCRAAIRAGGDDPALYPVLLLSLNYLHEEPEPILAAHREFGTRLPPAGQRPPWPGRAAGERLRVGYVSSDLVRHSVPFFLGPLLEHHDPERFEVTCYHGNARSDDVTARLKSCARHWVECAALSDEALARRIRADGIDILVDLIGHTAHSRSRVFAAAPAPLQIAYLGYPTVSGVAALDYRITDAVIDPDDLFQGPGELPLRLPRSMFCYRPDEQAPALAPPPALRNGHVTFGSFNNTAKLTDRTLDLWAAALNAVPGSRLLLKAASATQVSVRAGIESHLAARGIAAGRLTLLARTADDRSHLALYNEVDIALDSYPYNGATTSCEALWMGLPVLTRRGRTHTSRMGASLLGAIGRSGWVADNDAQFGALAQALAADPAALAAWRAGAREHLRTSALMDHAGYAREFEALLEQAAWHRGHGARDAPPIQGGLRPAAADGGLAAARAGAA
jgi:tetratricopeptide (TPR) repeat protein